MAFHHLLRRFSPRFNPRWLIALLILGVLVVVVSFIRPSGAIPPLQLMALGPDGRFQDTTHFPGAWSDTATSTPDGIRRFPLVLGVRNPGTLAQRPEQLELSLPLRYRLTGADGAELDPRTEEGSPLLTYSFRPGLGPVEPQRVPVMLPGQDTLWLEVLVPAYYCVALADSIPEFVPAPPPPLASLATLRIFYSFSGGDLAERQTGTLTLGLDTTALVVPEPEPLPSFPMMSDLAVAAPELGYLVYGGARKSRCGQPEDPMELLSTVWETPNGGRFITLDYGGAVRKRLYDLDGDGVIERESWDPDSDGVFEATRRARLRIPEFLLPITAAAAFDMTVYDALDPDSLARLDPFHAAMPGPGALPATGDSAAAERPAGQPDRALPDTMPEPRIQRPRPLGTPVRPDTMRRPVRDTGGVGGPGGPGGPGGVDAVREERLLPPLAGRVPTESRRQ